MSRENSTWEVFGFDDNFIFHISFQVKQKAKKLVLNAGIQVKQKSSEIIKVKLEKFVILSYDCVSCFLI